MPPIRRRPYPTPRSIRNKKFYVGSYKSSASSATTSRSRLSSLASKLGSESIITRQHDYGKQYRFKKMPYRKKKAWRKFTKKVVAVQLKQAGLRTVLFNSKGSLSNGPGYQEVVCLSLYGIAGTIDGNRTFGFNDMYRVFKNDPDIVQTGAAPGNVPKSGKLQFGSAVLDVTLRNLSADIEMEMDLYYGWFRKDDDATLAKANTNPQYKYDNAPADLIAPGNTPTNIGERGATLFDKPAGISATGYHITKKVKMILAPGQSTFIQHRDAKNYMVDWTNVQDCGYAKKGLTFGIWVVFKPSVTASTDAVATLGVGATRKYSYAVVEDNLDRIAVNPSN